MINHPNKLLSLSDSNTNYTINLKVTKPLMLYKGINVCMMNNNGDAILQRLTNTSLNFSTSHSFSGPDIGNISMIMVAPEDDNLYLKDVLIHIENDDKIVNYEFEYNSIIGGGRNSVLAACIRPKIYSDIDMKPIYDAEYKTLKDNILLQTSELTILGTLILSCISGMNSGYAFGLGGMLGLLYIKLLQGEVDIIEKRTRFQNILGNSSSRLALIICLVAAVITKYKEQIHDDNLLFIEGVAGFFMYKVALIESYINKK